MNIKDLEVFNEMPFFFWVKDEQGKYLWANQALSQFAQEEVIGKTDYDLIWAENADALRAVDQQVLETGKTRYLHEKVDKSGHGKATLNVCKFVGQLDGKKHVFDISFVIE